MIRVLVLACLAAAACSSSAAMPFPNFVGTWMINSGSSIEATCPAPVGNVSTKLAGNLEVLPGVGADLVTLEPLHGCDVTYSVMGNVATGTGGLSCTHPGMTMNVTETDTFTAITLTTADGKTMTEAAMGNAVFMSMAGNLTCPFTVAATFAKVSNLH